MHETPQNYIEFASGNKLAEESTAEPNGTLISMAKVTNLFKGDNHNVMA